MNSSNSWGYDFKNPSLKDQALTHKSFHYESKRASQGHNEKIEFLGDAVLDLVLSELLMERFPSDSEGNLSKKRSSLVNENILAQIAKDLKITESLQMGKGELMSGGDKKPRLMASTYEALIGAVFLDGGFESARSWIRPHFVPLLEKFGSTDDFDSDHKTRLQEEVQAVMKEAPVYGLIKEEGPSHDKTFYVEVKIKGRALTTGNGKTKKAAEQEAARLALEIWKKAKEELK